MAECECLCARVQGVGGWVFFLFFFFLESMTRHFLHPASAADYGQCAQPCLAAPFDDDAQYTHWLRVNRAGCARERSCVTGE